jgi:hypothetical protein
MNCRIYNHSTRILNKNLLSNNTKIGIKDWHPLQVQVLQLIWLKVSALNLFKRYPEQQAYSFKIIVEHTNTRPDHEQTRNFSEYQLKRYPNQKTYVFKSARSLFPQNAKIGIRNSPSTGAGSAAQRLQDLN